MNTVTQQAVTKMNEAKQGNVLSIAQCHIANITSYQASVKTYQAAVKAEQESAAKLAVDVLSYQDVTGQSLPTAPNTNQVTIIKAIAARNEANQNAVASRIQTHLNNVEANNRNIKSMNDAIAREREALAKLSVDVVDVAAVVGE